MANDKPKELHLKRRTVCSVLLLILLVLSLNYLQLVLYNVSIANQQQQHRNRFGHPPDRFPHRAGRKNNNRHLQAEYPSPYLIPPDDSTSKSLSSSSSVGQTEKRRRYQKPYDDQQHEEKANADTGQRRNTGTSHALGGFDRSVRTNTMQTTTTTAPATTTTTATAPVRKWAYAFLIGGCATSKPQYRGFLYSVVAASKIFRDSGSTADVVVMIQMSVDTNETQLPSSDLQLLHAAGVRVHYLPKFSAKVHEVFYALVLEKFRILQLTEYSRVMFLDADIVPRCSLDYIFDLSEPKQSSNDSLAVVQPPPLRENVILSYKKDAANAGFFMLKPSPNDFDLLQKIIHAKEKRASRMPYPQWDPVKGWGHRIVAPDYWRDTFGGRGTEWSWFCAYADQGLVYHWTKYIKQSVSIIINNETEHWVGTEIHDNHRPASSSPDLERIDTDLLRPYTCNKPREEKGYTRPAPYRDFIHFTGRGKPWETNYPPMYSDSVATWSEALEAVARSANISLDWDFNSGNVDGSKRDHGTSTGTTTGTETKVTKNDPPPPPPVGRASNYVSMMEHIRAKKASGWNAYE